MRVFKNYKSSRILQIGANNKNGVNSMGSDLNGERKEFLAVESHQFCLFEGKSESYGAKIDLQAGKGKNLGREKGIWERWE